MVLIRVLICVIATKRIFAFNVASYDRVVPSDLNSGSYANVLEVMLPLATVLPCTPRAVKKIRRNLQGKFVSAPRGRARVNF